MNWNNIYHLPYSKYEQHEKVLTLKNMVDSFYNKEVVYLEKLNGELFSISRQNFQKRESNKDIESIQIVKDLHEIIHNEIPKNFILYGINMLKTKEIYYDELSSYFYIFAIKNTELNIILSIDETIEWVNSFNLEFVPVIRRGIFDTKVPIPPKSKYGNTCQGYIVRNIHNFYDYESHYNIVQNSIILNKNNATWIKNYEKNKLKDKYGNI